MPRSEASQTTEPCRLGFVPLSPEDGIRTNFRNAVAFRYLELDKVRKKTILQNVAKDRHKPSKFCYT
jgi:hypothetical protein